MFYELNKKTDRTNGAQTQMQNATPAICSHSNNAFIRTFVPAEVNTNYQRFHNYLSKDLVC